MGLLGDTTSAFFYGMVAGGGVYTACKLGDKISETDLLERARKNAQEIGDHAKGLLKESAKLAVVTSKAAFQCASGVGKGSLWQAPLAKKMPKTTEAWLLHKLELAGMEKEDLEKVSQGYGLGCKKGRLRLETFRKKVLQTLVEKIEDNEERAGGREKALYLIEKEALSAS